MERRKKKEEKNPDLRKLSFHSTEITIQEWRESDSKFTIWVFLLNGTWDLRELRA